MINFRIGFVYIVILFNGTKFVIVTYKPNDMLTIMILVGIVYIVLNDNEMFHNMESDSNISENNYGGESSVSR